MTLALLIPPLLARKRQAIQHFSALPPLRHMGVHQCRKFIVVVPFQQMSKLMTACEFAARRLSIRSEHLNYGWAALIS